MCNECQKQSEIKFYNGNPVKILAKSGDYFIVELLKGLSTSEISQIASNNCQACLTGMKEYCQCETLESLIVDVEDILTANMGVVFVHKNMLMDEPVEFKKYKEIQEQSEKTLKNLKETEEKKKILLQEIEGLEVKKSNLQEEINDLEENIEKKKVELSKQAVVKQKEEDAKEPQQQNNFSLALNKQIVFIEKDKLISLLKDSQELSLLEGDGVDNWGGYFEGYNEFLATELNYLLNNCDDKTKIKDLLLAVGIKSEEVEEVLNLMKSDDENDLEKLSELLDLDRLSKLEFLVKFSSI